MKLSITTEKNGENQRKTFLLSGSEIEALRLYSIAVARVGDLAHKVEQEVDYKIAISSTWSHEHQWHIGESAAYVRLTSMPPYTKFEASLPDDVLVDAFLHRMRMFLVRCEGTSTGNIFKILRKAATPHMEEQLNGLEDEYDNLPAGYRMRIDDDELLGHEGLSLWLNAREYHWDTKKRALLDVWGELIDDKFLTAQRLCALTARFWIISKLNDRFVLSLLERIDSSEV